MNDRLKISLFLPSLRIGGAEKVFLNLAKGFLEKDLLVDLVLSQKEGGYISNIPKGANIVDLHSKRIMFSFLPLVRYLKREKPDVLISAMPHVNIIAILANIFSGSKTNIIATEHNSPSVDQKKVFFIKRVVTRLLVKLLYGGAKAVVAVSQGVAEDFKKTFNYSMDNLRVIYNPIDIADIEEKAKQEVDHLWLKDKEVPVILGVGRLTEQKDFSTLIRAFSKLREKKEACLIILGRGGDRRKLKKLIKKLELEGFVDMLEFVENPYAYMANADVFVLSSIHEGLPTVLIEAMVCGTPVVSTDCPSGPAEILESGKYGRLTPVGDEEALAKAIKETLDNPINSERLRKRVMDFSKNRAIDKYLQLITNGK